MRNIALRLAYDGTDFVGSQWQNSGRSVQGELEGAWAQFAQEHKRFVFAGRTDAGVHAQGQVANVRSTTQHSTATVQRGLNALLPSDIAVLDVWEAPLEFHARYSATRRAYRYLIDNARVPLPWLRNWVLHVAQPLDVTAMDLALQSLVGQHDFVAFTRASQEQKSTVRHCYHASCATVELLGRPLIAVELAANGFLHHMVRSIVGTLLLVGQGRFHPEDVQRILTSKDRRQSGRVVVAHGLILMTVDYPADVLYLNANTG